MARTFYKILSAIIIGVLLSSNAQILFAMPLGQESPSGQTTQPDVVNTDWENYQDIPETFVQVAENDLFKLYVNQATLGFKVVDKRSGYVWHSNIDEKIEGDRLNKTWTAFAQSGISIDFLDAEAISNRASITTAENTIEVKSIDQGFEATITFTEPSITLLLRVTLEANGVKVEVPFDSLVEADPAFKLGVLHVYPFFGATREAQVPGYMFLPDGSGSLIRFSATTRAQNMYYGRYYGDDLGMLGQLTYEPYIKRPLNVALPVFGMVHGYKQNAFIATVENGATYGQINAHPAGIITNFNFLYNTFIYNESYFQATNRSGAGVTTLQQATNAFDVRIHYRFLTGNDSDYVGMARSYQQYLVEQGVLRPLADQPAGIGIRLEFLAGEKERFIFWHRFIAMTTISQMAEMLDGLEVNNPQVIYYGWQPLGASSMPPGRLRLDGRLGSLGELNDLISTIEGQGGNLSLYLDPQAGLIGESGYSPRYDLAMSITNENLVGYNRNKVNYYLNFNALSTRYNALSSQVFSDLGAGLALDGIGWMLYSDFKRGNFLNREEAIQRYQSLFADDSGRTSFYRPNEYMLRYAEAYYDIPITNNGYIYTTDAVPFVEIVLAGYLPYFGTALNFSSDMRMDLLRHIDYGVYPSYFLTHEVTARILNTPSNWIYTSSYDQWAGEINQTYQWLNELLGPVRGQSIVARDILEPGVAAVTYSNQMQIIVNYNQVSYFGDNVVVEAQDAVIREVAP